MNKFIGWIKRHKFHTVVIVLLLVAVIALAVAGSKGVFNRKPADTASSETKVTVEVPAGTEKTPVTINVITDDSVTKDSTPTIVHVQSIDKRSKPVDFYHAVDSGKKTTIIELSPGEYIITVTGVINKDGSVSKPETKSKKIVLSIKSTAKSGKTENKARVNVKLDKTIGSEKVTSDDVKKIAETTKNAVEKGDSSLKGDAGKSILDKVETNTKANKNISEEDKKAVEESTSSAVKATETKPALTVTAPPTSASNQESKPAEKGHWENTTEKVWVPNIVEEPVYETKELFYVIGSRIEKVDEKGYPIESSCTGEKLSEEDYGSKQAVMDECRRRSYNELKNRLGKGYKYTVGELAWLNYTFGTETKRIKVGTKKVDRGHYETRVTGKKWVVD